MDVPAATIRRATEPDLQPLCALLQSYYSEWSIQQQDSPAIVLDYLRHPLLGFFVAEVEHTLAGCVLCRCLPTIAGAVECKRLFVAPPFRGRGLSSLLMDAAESAAQASGARWIYLDSKLEFTAALALYRRRGYLDCPRFNDNAQATIFLRKPFGHA